MIQNFNMKVYAGERIWLRGKNGTGKSTLLKLLGREMEGAEVIYADSLKIAFSYQEPMWKKGWIKELFYEEAMKQEKKFMSQGSDKKADFLKQKSVSEQDQMIKQQYKSFQEICERFELPEDYEERPIETLSSGELKKIDLARTLSMDNELLFLDEPLNYMDVNFKEQLEHALCDSKVSVVFVEHNKAFGRKVASRVITLKE